MSDVDGIDAEVLRSVAKALGAVRLAELLVIFEARIGWLSTAVAATPGDPSGLLATLHQSRGSAASLGFTRLDRALAGIEQWLKPAAAHDARFTARIDVPGRDVPRLSELVAALEGAWQASLAAAAKHVPGLRHQRPFGSNR